MPVNIHIEGAGNSIARLRAAQAALAAETRLAMEESLIRLEATERTLAPQDTRSMAGGISHTIEGSGAALIGRTGPNARYAYWANYGRKPGKQPPIAAISGWARRKGIPPYVVARAIGRHGTRATLFMERSLQQNESRIAARFEQIGQRVVTRIGS